jgi:hypothetical protein
MFVVHRPVTNYNHPMEEQVELRCHVCGRRFRSLEEAWLAYPVPALGARAETRWVHRKCLPEPAGADAPRLLRADFALRRLIESLARPVRRLAVLKDLPGPRRPWGNP